MAADERRKHLLGVARHIVETESSAAMTMEAVSQRAGVSRGLLYAYFANRLGLLQALWSEVEMAWGIEPMAPPNEMIRGSSARQVFETRLVENTQWYFDRIGHIGLLHHRLLAEPQLQHSISTMRRRIHHDNVLWWAELLELMGIDGKRAMVFSSIFNGATVAMWELLASETVDRAIIEEVFYLSSRATLDQLLELVSVP